MLRNKHSFQPGQSAGAEQDGFAGDYTKEPGFVSYFELCMLEKQGGWTRRQDNDGNTYMTKDKLWAGFDTPAAIKRKVESKLNKTFYKG